MTRCETNEMKCNIDFFQIRCDFLPVGHTHEDIDAFFGVLAQSMKLRDAYDIEGMSLSFHDWKIQHHDASKFQ